MRLRLDRLAVISACVFAGCAFVPPTVTVRNPESVGAAVAEPTLAAEPAGTWVKATYVVWGLPRDLADAPFTALNRAGVGTFFKTTGCEVDVGNGKGSVVVIAGAAIAGSVVGFVQGWHAAAPHFFQRVIYTNVGAGLGGLAGAAIGAAAVGAYGTGVIPLQTALLRSGFDDEYLKGNRAKLKLDGAWTEESIAAWERHERSLAYFPNWRYGVCGEYRTMPGESVATAP